MMLLQHTFDTISVLAQGIELPPEPPPKAEKLLTLGRWASWVVMFAGVLALVYGGGKFGWEKFNGGSLESPKIIAGALVGGVVAASAGGIMASVVS